MLALKVGVEEATTTPADNTEGYTTIAAINSPSSVTVPGHDSGIGKIHQMAKEHGLFARKLKVEMVSDFCHTEQVTKSYSEHF